MILSFRLTMPSVGSWNNKWTGAGNLYCVIRKVSKTFMKKQPHFERLLLNKKDNFYHNFGDGWGANVEVEIVDSSEAAKRRKASSGFCGYEWMIESIMFYGKIQTGQTV